MQGIEELLVSNRPRKTEELMKDAHILVFPSDGTGCGMYRMIWPGQAVYNKGKPINVMQRPPQIVVDDFGKIHGINVGTADVIVFQRPGSYQIAEVIPILQENGVKVIIDMDDSLSTIHPRNSAFKIYDPRVNHKTNWMHAAKACNLADLVTVTTEGLANEYGSHGRVKIIPNFIPESYLKIPRPENKIPIVGWTGWTSTHVDDLRVTNGIINQVLIDTGAKFAAFGDEKIFIDLGIRYREPHEHWGFSNINEYPQKLARMDIGLVPLQISPFNNSKSRLKALEMSGTGVVPIMSPTPDNLLLHELGIGLIAEKPRDWYDHVKNLILDSEMREEMSKKGREIVSGLTIEKNWELWWSAWSSVVN